VGTRPTSTVSSRSGAATRRGQVAAFARATALLPGGGPSIPAVLPSRELLAAALLAAGDAPAAAAAYDSALAAFPGRSSLLLGAARAYAAAGDAAGSARRYAALRANWARADADLPALAEATRGRSPARPAARATRAP
jgi:thioredoxin-like negative regulator of GroEL